MRFGHRLAGEFGDLLDELVGLGNAERHRDGGMLAGVVVLQPGKGLGGRVGADAEGRLAVDGVSRIIQLGAAGIGVVGAVAGGVEHVGDVAQDRQRGRRTRRRAACIHGSCRCWRRSRGSG